MIIVKNRELLIPREEFNIGTSYDSGTEVRMFRLEKVTAGGIDLSGLSFHLDIKYTNGSEDTAFLQKLEDTDDYINLQLDIASTMLQVPGTVLVQIRALTPDGTLRWSSYPGAFFVEDHINTPASYTGDLTELEQIEAYIENREQLRQQAMEEWEAGVDEAEQTRQANEEERQANEAEREAAENERKIAENQRNVDEATRESDMNLIRASASTTLGQIREALEDVEDAEEQMEILRALAAEVESKLASGAFVGEKGEKGDKGDTGDSGVYVPISGFIALSVENDGYLYLYAADEREEDLLDYDSDTGILYYVVQGGS